MRMRSWAVGMVSAAAVVAGLVAVQSGIAGTAALPVLPHRTGAAVSGGGTELPAPVEVGAPPGAGPVRTTPAGRVVVVPERHPAPGAGDPAKRPAPAGAGKGAKDAKDASGKDPKADPKPEPETDSKPDDKSGKGADHSGTG